MLLPSFQCGFAIPPLLTRRSIRPPRKWTASFTFCRTSETSRRLHSAEPRRSACFFRWTLVVWFSSSSSMSRMKTLWPYSRSVAICEWKSLTGGLKVRQVLTTSRYASTYSSSPTTDEHGFGFRHIIAGAGDSSHTWFFYLWKRSEAEQSWYWREFLNSRRNRGFMSYLIWSASSWRFHDQLPLRCWEIVRDQAL